MRRCRASRTARAGDASQIVRGPVLLSGNTARSPCTCSPLEPERLGLARAGVEQETQSGDGDRMIRFRVVERPTERSELVVRQVVRLEARLAPPQSPARVGVLAPHPERLRMLHHRRQHRQRPVRRSRPRDREIVEPVAHVLRGKRIDAPIAEPGQYEMAHAVRVRSPRRGLPAFGAVGEERRRERPHRRDRRRCAARFGIGDDRARRVPRVLDRQRGGTGRASA